MLRLRCLKSLLLTRKQSWKIILITFICCSSFIIIQNIDLTGEANSSNNYGLDCKFLQQILKSGKDEEIQKYFVDTTYTNTHIIKEKNTNRHMDFSIKLRPLLNCLEADDMYLEKVLKDSYLVPPAGQNVNYNLTSQKSLEMSSQHQALDVMEMVYKNKLRNGFFVEAGAADCEFSVSLPLEYNYGWTGVLVEMSPKYYEQCRQKRRKSYLLNSCIGVEKQAHFTQFNLFSTSAADTEINHKAMSGFSNDNNGSDNEGAVTVQCFNLESIIYAAGRTTVNLFILDIEGYELAALRSIRWEKVDIEVLSVETDLAGRMMKDSSPKIIEEFMKNKGYTRFEHRNDISKGINGNQNTLFVRNDIVKKYNVVQL